MTRLHAALDAPCRGNKKTPSALTKSVAESLESETHFIEPEGVTRHSRHLTVRLCIAIFQASRLSQSQLIHCKLADELYQSKRPSKPRSEWACTQLNRNVITMRVIITIREAPQGCLSIWSGRIIAMRHTSSVNDHVRTEIYS